MSQYSSGEFHPDGTGHAINGGSMAIFGTDMHYLVPHSNDTLVLSTLKLDGLLENDPASVTNDDNWHSIDLKDLISANNSAKFESEGRPQLVAFGESLYAFWVDHHNTQVYAAFMNSDGGWSAALRVNRDEDTRLKDIDSYISVYTVSNCIVLNWSEKSGSARTLETITLRTDDIDTSSGTWYGETADSVDPTRYGVSPGEDYYKISTQWYSQGNDGDTRLSWLVAGFYSSDARESKHLIIPIDDLGRPETGGNRRPVSLGSFNESRELELIRDPAGRIMALFCHDDDDHDPNVSYRLLNTHQTVEDGIEWGESVMLDSGVNFHSHSSEEPVTGIFLNSGNYSGDVTITDGQGNPEERQNVSQYTTYLFVAYARQDQDNGAYEIKAQMGQYGIASMIEDLTTLKPEDPSVASINMIMDAFPLDNSYVVNTQGPGSLISVVYGATASTKRTHSVSAELMFGIKSELKTNKGVGPAYEFEMKTGASGLFEQSHEVIQQSAYSVETAVNQYTVNNQGALYGSTAFDLIEDAFVFQDIHGQTVGGTSAPLYSRIRPVKGDAHLRKPDVYQMYAYQPGDIHSYTEDAINERMASIYNGLTADIQNKFPDGYANDYIGEVVQPRAYVISGSVEHGDAQKYLEFTVSETGISREGFQVIDKLLIELGVKIEGSGYLGVGYGEEVSIFGFGEGFSGSTMVGFDFRVEALASTQTNTQWGLSMDPSSSFPFGVPESPSYTVHMYILAPDRLWADELRYFSTDGPGIEQKGFEDSISEPSKIMYIVYL